MSDIRKTWLMEWVKSRSHKKSYAQMRHEIEYSYLAEVTRQSFLAAIDEVEATSIHAG